VPLPSKSLKAIELFFTELWYLFCVCKVAVTILRGLCWTLTIVRDIYHTSVSVTYSVHTFVSSLKP